MVIKSRVKNCVLFLIVYQKYFLILSNLDGQELFYLFSCGSLPFLFKFLKSCVFTGCMHLHLSLALGITCFHLPTKCKVGVEHFYSGLEDLWP